MEVKTGAIVLQAIDYKDNDKLLTLFSPSLGKITAGIRGVKKPTAKFAFAAQPFCFAEYVLAEKGGRYTVTSAYLHESFFALRLDIAAFYAACAAAEICKTVVPENEAHDGLFIGFAECLKSLSLAEEEKAESLIAFLLIALRESGYPIDLEFFGKLPENLYFDFAEGRFSDFESLVRGERASLSTYQVLRKCAGLDYDEQATLGGRKRALRLLKAFLSEKTDCVFENLNEFIKLYEEN